MSRDITEVIDRILEEIPASEKYLISGLNSIRKSACFAAPEVQPILWEKATMVLIGRFGPTPAFDELWHKTILEIWRGDR